MTSSFAERLVRHPAFRLQAMTGERRPLAPLPDLDPLIPATRLSGSVEARFPELLELVVGCFAVDDTNELVERCARFLDVDLETATHEALLDSLLNTLLHEDDAEGGLLTSRLFDEIYDPSMAALPVRVFLERVIDRYRAVTAYLLPILGQYGAVARSAAGAMEASEVALFLRDGLTFWPALVDPASFIIYTRWMRELDLAPIVFSPDGDRYAVRTSAKFERSLLLDVGLYGTLICALDRKGLLSDAAVLFLGSRNPKVAGFLNCISQLEVPDRIAFERRRDIVRYVDTIECLLKPFLLRNNAGGSVMLRIGDPISLCCSIAFASTLHAYARAHGPAPVKNLLVVPPPGSWFVSEPIPAWTGAPEFLATWTTNGLVPKSTVAGWVAHWKNRS